MDIDVLSRLMHEAYLAERNYQAVGAMNTYGLGILEAENLNQRFQKAKNLYLLSDQAAKLYAKCGDTEAARREAAARVFGITPARFLPR